LLLHYEHLSRVPSAEIATDPRPIEFEWKMRAVFQCENPACWFYMERHGPEIMGEVLELCAWLFTDSYYGQIARALSRRRCKPLLDPQTGELCEDLREVVTATLRIAREEMKT